MPRFPSRPTAALALALALLLPACSDSTEAGAPTADDTVPTSAPTTTTPPDDSTTTTLAPTPEQEVEAAYLEAFEAYFHAGVNPSVSHDLAAHFDGEALQAVQANIERLRENGLVADYPDGLPNVTVTTLEMVDDETAVLSGCIVDEGRKVVIADGTFTDEVPTSRSTHARLVLAKGSWRVAGHQTANEWPNAAGCLQ